MAGINNTYEHDGNTRRDYYTVDQRTQRLVEKVTEEDTTTEYGHHYWKEVSREPYKDDD